MRAFHRRRPSPALAISLVALFAALGGGAWAATSDSKSDKKIAKNAAKSYFNGHIGGASVSHASTAGTATSATNATHATNADQLGGVAAASFVCPSGTTALAGSCFETSERAAQDWFGASKTCAAAGRHLPSADQLNGVGRNGSLTWSGQEVSSDVFFDGTSFRYMSVTNAGTIAVVTTNIARPFRCVTNPTG
jgi:hypothetical protein